MGLPFQSLRKFFMYFFRQSSGSLGDLFQPLVEMYMKMLRFYETPFQTRVKAGKKR